MKDWEKAIYYVMVFLSGGMYWIMKIVMKKAINEMK